MVEAFTAIYEQEDDDWTIAVSGRGTRLTATAPGIIAARDRTDQLVEKILPEGKATVVHLLNGSALEFTAAYITARLTRPDGPSAPLEVPPPAVSPKDGQSKAKVADKPAMPPGKQLTKAVEARKPSAEKGDELTRELADFAEQTAGTMPVAATATPPTARA